AGGDWNIRTGGAGFLGAEGSAGKRRGLQKTREHFRVENA
ncbi:MAG: hypothetical protein ACD_75C02578G0005, partial [uncultured bacterium]